MSIPVCEMSININNSSSFIMYFVPLSRREGVGIVDKINRHGKYKGLVALPVLIRMYLPRERMYSYLRAGEMGLGNVPDGGGPAATSAK